MKPYPFLFICLGLATIFAFSCKKKTKTTNSNTNTNPITCILGMSTLVVNDTIYNVIADTTYPTMNNTFYTEHKIGAGHGASVEFEGSNFPVAGDFTVTPNFNEVVPGSKKVYMQYYTNGVSYDAQSGVVRITGSGGQSLIEFCKIKFKESFGDEKTASLKCDME